ncbi:MAG TPA: hypothetical protein VHC73_04125 [Vitreimonas sp.]|jgi:hypothetical protein|nr:hypothetical protein [Vitreimonas sp.]
MEVAVKGPGKFAVTVVGVSQYQPVLDAAAKEDAPLSAVLTPEDDNAHDDQAVAVHLHGQRVGYLSRADARRFRADLVRTGYTHLSVRCKAKIVGGFETAAGKRAHLGLKLDLPRFSG